MSSRIGKGETLDCLRELAVQEHRRMLEVEKAKAERAQAEVERAYGAGPINPARAWTLDKDGTWRDLDGNVCEGPEGK